MAPTAGTARRKLLRYAHPLVSSAADWSPTDHLTQGVGGWQVGLIDTVLSTFFGQARLYLRLYLLLLHSRVYCCSCTVLLGSTAHFFGLPLPGVTRAEVTQGNLTNAHVPAVVMVGQCSDFAGADGPHAPPLRYLVAVRRGRLAPTGVFGGKYGVPAGRYTSPCHGLTWRHVLLLGVRHVSSSGYPQPFTPASRLRVGAMHRDVP